MSKRIERLEKLASAVVTDIDSIVVADNSTTTSATVTLPPEGIYCSARTWNKNGKPSLYSGFVLVDYKLYGKQFSITVDQCRLVLENLAAIKTFMDKEKQAVKLLRLNADKIFPLSMVLDKLQAIAVEQADDADNDE